MLEIEVAENAYKKKLDHLRYLEYNHINSLLKLWDSGVIDAEKFATMTMDMMWSEKSAVGVEAQKKTLDGIKLRDFIINRELNPEPK